MSKSEPGWLSVRRKGDREVVVTMASAAHWDGPLEVVLDVGDWSRMLSKPGDSVHALVRFAPKL